MILECCPQNIDRILFRQNDYGYKRGVTIDNVLYDYAVSKDDKLVLLIKCIDTENLLAQDRNEAEFKNYAGVILILLLIVDLYEGCFSDSLGKDICIVLRNPEYVEEHNKRIVFDIDLVSSAFFIRSIQSGHR